MADLDTAAAHLQVARRTAASWAVSGKVPGIKVGGSWRFWLPAIDAAMGGPAPTIPDDDPIIITPEELSQLLGFSSQATYKLLRDGAIPAVKANTRWRIYWPVIRDSLVQGQPLVNTEKMSDTSDSSDEAATE